MPSHNAQSGTLEITPALRIPCAEFWFTYSRSSGPGGQNVNKVSTRATMHWAVLASKALPEAVRQRFQRRFANRINSDGILLISSDSFRSQVRNANDCLSRLQAMLVDVAKPPKRRRKTKPSRGSVERRLASKRANSARKKDRRSARRPESD